MILNRKNLVPAAIVIAIVLLYAGSIHALGFTGIKDSAWTVTKAVASGIFHPDWSYVWDGSGEDLVSLMLETVGIAFLGTFISALFGIPFAFLAARNM